MDPAFAGVYDELLPVVYRFVSVRVPSSDVEDLTAEVMAKIWRAWPGFKGQSSRKTWALRIAYHQLADYYRNLQRKPALIPLDLANQSETDHSENWSTMLSISQALAKMTTQQVAVLQLRLVEGFSAVEAGRVLGMSPAAVDSVLYRAKKSFRRLYHGTTGGAKDA